MRRERERPGCFAGNGTNRLILLNFGADDHPGTGESGRA